MFLFDIIIIILIASIFYIIFINRLAYIDMVKGLWKKTCEKAKTQEQVEDFQPAVNIKKDEKYMNKKHVGKEKVVYRSAYRIKKTDAVKSGIINKDCLINIKKTQKK